MTLDHLSIRADLVRSELEFPPQPVEQYCYRSDDQMVVELRQRLMVSQIREYRKESWLMVFGLACIALGGFCAVLLVIEFLR